MFSQTINPENPESEQVKTFLSHPELYLKNLAEYQKMLELLSLNEHLTDLLGNDEPLRN